MPSEAEKALRSFFVKSMTLEGYEIDITDTTDAFVMTRGGVSHRAIMRLLTYTVGEGVPWSILKSGAAHAGVGGVYVTNCMVLDSFQRKIIPEIGLHRIIDKKVILELGVRHRIQDAAEQAVKRF
jgi:hypothetical protein